MSDTQNVSPVQLQGGLFPKQVIKAGLVFGVVVAIINLVGIIPIIGCFVGVLVWIVGIISGYTIINVLGGRKENIGDVLKKSIATGLISGFIAGIGAGLASVLVTVLFFNSSFLGVYYTPGLADYISGFVSAMIGSVIGMILWNVVGGVLAVYYGPEKLPASLRSNADKLKNFINK